MQVLDNIELSYSRPSSVSTRKAIIKEMETKSYSHADHYEMLCGWLAARDIGAPVPSLLPNVGLCVDNVAIGFLVVTNSGIASLENFATNPTSDSFSRTKALNILISSLEQLASDYGYSAITVATSISSFEKRLVKDHGYFKYEQSAALVFKEIR